jgi:hypothetical protein
MRPRNRYEKRALFKRLNVMRQVLVQCEQGACGQIERPAFRSHEDMVVLVVVVWAV